MMIAVALSVYVPDQAHLLARLAVGGKETATINVLIKQGIATT